jgi:hypothetical protein
MIGERMTTRLVVMGYGILNRARDPRAADILTSIHGELQARAATITDAGLQDSFLNGVPENRSIITPWAAHQAAFSGRQK